MTDDIADAGVEGVRRTGLMALLCKTISFRAAALIIVATVAVVSCTVVSFQASVDGVLYIANAKSLFTNDFSRDYVLYREPGYPLFLRIVHYFGDSDLLLIFVQSLCLGLAGFIALYAIRRALGRSSVTIVQVVVTTVLLLNPMYLIYSGLVLQQALFALQLAFVGLGVVWAIQRPARLPRSVLLLLVFLNYFAAIWTSIGWLYLALVPVIVTVVLVLWPVALTAIRRAATPLWKAVTGTAIVAGVMLLSAAVYLGGLRVYDGWEAVKAPYVSAAKYRTSIIDPLVAVPHIPTVDVLATRMLALMHFGTIEPFRYENDMFMNQATRPLYYGRWDTTFVSEPFTSYAVGYFALSERSSMLFPLYFAMPIAVAGQLYGGAFIGLLILTLLAFIRWKWRLLIVLSTPLVFLGVYAASNTSIDRYGIPAYPWAAVAVGAVVAWAGRWLLSFRRAPRVRAQTSPVRHRAPN